MRKLRETDGLAGIFLFGDQVLISPLSLTGSQMNNPDALTNWVLGPPPPRPNDAPTGTHPDVAFAHFEGPQATNKSRWLPEALWTSFVSGGRSETSIVHVVAKSKLRRLSRVRAEHVAEETARGVIPVKTVDYQELLRELRASRQNGRWHLRATGPLAHRSVFIIEVDPDFSADFFLALYAAVEFSLSVTEEQPQAAMRLATMSWEPADELYSRLVQQTEHGIITFVLPGNSEPYISFGVGSGEEEPFQAIISKLDQLGSDDLHTVVYFQDEDRPPPRWKEDEWEGWGWTREVFELDPHGRFPVQDEPTGSVMLRVPCDTRGFGRLETDGYVHIIPSRTRQRPIFDMQTRQVVRVELRVSQSERFQQLSWVDRTTCPRSRVCAYPDVESPIGHPRRKDILNSQLAGLIAGLVQFEGWPSRIRSLPRLIAVLVQEDETIRGIFDQTAQRLVFQGLLQMEGPESGPIISLKGGIPNIFSALLPLVDYDTRLAYLLVQPSDRLTTLFKTQVAAMVTIGQDKVVDFSLGVRNEVDKAYVKIAMALGYGKNLASFGTLWMAWETRCHEIHDVLSPTLQAPEALDETEILTDDQVEALYWDCLRAFAFQIGVVTFPSDGGYARVHDFVSGVELTWDWGFLLIDFDAIKKNDPECTVGFYTTLFRDEFESA
ncbi:uncharacterized protein NECHADRAFT_85153 [Fusarium vanettenii 77-13-4]|uniref:Uncharacterized protein n=1 Tax=Fusarium vanettenii (strain ATCC MYA-4622 / CBS 123669 / FGSC 9596 / NRRL 45880 / 77-13-4) TaxID=660122 RepID=C7YV51_FUSV7|nr:uncharacterized protein NECHADRAFT_85153 [Fusarium vanettenii 77-13-4]EEU44520.1 predicted protein [Fusarium vanettenii 77-13-4]